MINSRAGVSEESVNRVTVAGAGDRVHSAAETVGRAGELAAISPGDP